MSGSEQILRFDSAAEIADEVARELSDLAAAQPALTIGLTGGTLGIAVAAQLAQHSDLQLTRLHCLFGDERYVGLGDAERNEAQALAVWPALAETALLRYPDPAGQTDLSQARDNFEQQLRDSKFLAGFDVLLLGVGPDGHVASLFPGHARSGELVVAEPESPKPPAERLSLSYELLNRAKRVWFIAAGSAKAEAIRASLEPGSKIPAARVRGRVETKWFIDSEIAAQLA